MRPNKEDVIRLGEGQGYKTFAANLKREMGWKPKDPVPGDWHQAWLYANNRPETEKKKRVPASVLINIAKKDVEGSIRLNGKKQMLEAITGNHVTVNLDRDTWHKLPDIYWQMLAFVESIRFTDEDLGNAWMVEVPK